MEEAVERARRSALRRVTVLLFPSGAAIGFLGAMLGIGGGFFATPLLHYGVGMRLRRSVSTALILVFATSFSATVTEILHADSALDWGVLALLVPAGLVGAQVGYRVSRRIGTKVLRKIFVAVLLVAAARILFSGGSAEAVDGERAALSTRAIVTVLAVGVGGGFLAPLLGIGGGILVVPGLFLGVPQLGYLGARACSMGLATITSLRSAWLTSRDGNVDLRRGAWLGSGALVGAVLGVGAVHLPGWSEAARIMMGVALGVVSLRMAWDLRALRERP